MRCADDGVAAGDFKVAVASGGGGRRHEPGVGHQQQVAAEDSRAVACNGKV